MPIFENLPVLPFLIKRAALGNLKASFHCAHLHSFFPLRGYRCCLIRLILLAFNCCRYVFEYNKSSIVFMSILKC